MYIFWITWLLPDWHINWWWHFANNSNFLKICFHWKLSDCKILQSLSFRTKGIRLDDRNNIGYCIPGIIHAVQVVLRIHLVWLVLLEYCLLFVSWCLRHPHWGDVDGAEGIFGLYRACVGCVRTHFKKALCCTCPLVGRRTNEVKLFRCPGHF